jgi:hypothetical protein
MLGDSDSIAARSLMMAVTIVQSTEINLIVTVFDLD